MPLDRLSIRGAREHNLKGFDLDIPRDRLVVITGLSGSGKSSLAFDTVYAEGQRRYVESLSAYARQFLGQMSKPDVDHIDGLSPAVSIDQKTTSRNPRSTVGTVTEIYDYLRLLFARVGVPHCPICMTRIERQTPEQIVDRISELPAGTRFQVLAPVVRGRKGEFGKLLDDLRREGFTRVRVDGAVRELSEDVKLGKKYRHDIDVVVDRLVMKDGIRTRLADSVEMALRLADGNVCVAVVDGDEETYSQALACPVHGVSMDELAPRDFSFNSPYGACPDCAGLGSRLEVDPDLVVPDPTLTLDEGAIKPFASGLNYYPQLVAAAARHLGADVDTSWEKLPADVRRALLQGLGDERIRVDYVTRDGRETHWYSKYEGAMNSVLRRFGETDSEGVKDKLREYMALIPCRTCHGARLKPEILAVTFGGKNIHEVTAMSAAASLHFFSHVELTERQHHIADRVIKEIVERLRFLVDVGLDYLTLERATGTLSGGEAQRIRLATQIGSGLMGVLYILDEPSIGLHQRDNARLIATLERLRDVGNTVIVVEHDEETIRAADFVVDMGPGAGEHGGGIVCVGRPEEVLECEESLTGAYLSGRRSIAVPERRRGDGGRGAVRLLGAAEHNLKGIDVEFPLGKLTVVTGVSGSGKSSLVTDTLAPALSNVVYRGRKRAGKHRALEGAAAIDKVVDIDQSPIGRTPRSNPATYTGVWDDIRALYASTPEAKARGYAQGRFSFNVKGGRCEACKGDGQIKIEMHFLPDVYVPCEVCKGARYNRETLQVTYKGKDVSDILDMTVEEALHFFENIPPVARKLQTLFDVGLGYIRLGQPATTLSGGEAQRVKLASELQRRSTGRTFYILDEPTTGLHFDDVRQLLLVLQRLVEGGNTVLVIEHNLDVVKSADWIVDLGPEGGDRGGEVVVSGTPEQVAACAGSHTGRFLRPVLEGRGATVAPELSAGRA
ncbi:MAG: excinuclease ABC subunit UvrA [Coriobacteriia bacterium]|nr:excinuclease ABC subunit UvrA [Coriobacteriia bacterium]